MVQNGFSFFAGVIIGGLVGAAVGMMAAPNFWRRKQEKS